MNGGINAKVIHRKAGDFATAWGFGFDAGIQIQAREMENRNCRKRYYHYFQCLVIQSY